MSKEAEMWRWCEGVLVCGAVMDAVCWCCQGVQVNEKGKAASVCVCEGALLC